MAYHADFWLTVGTVAPVMGLGHVVVLRRYFVLHQASIEADVRGWWNVVQGLAGFIAILPFITALMAWLLCLFEMLSALHSMAHEADADSLQGAINALVFVFCLFAVQLILVPIAHIAVRVGGGEPPDEVL